MDCGFGTLLKDWRCERHMSQLDLGLAANVSARHISFLETGRSMPSRSMVLQLSETLSVPRAARNVLLNAAGFAEAYRSRDLGEADMAHIRAAVEWTLQRHDPYPGFALDKHWVVIKANASAARLLGAVDLKPGDSLLQALLDSEKLRNALENWPEVARHMVARLRTENAQLGGDPVLTGAADKLANDAGLIAPATIGELSAVVPTRLRMGDTTLSLFSTIAQFGTAEDITLAELKIELLFPADDATRAVLTGVAAQSVDAGEAHAMRRAE
jgi:transcriptional regulator with XRE-family HTH domain